MWAIALRAIRSPVDRVAQRRVGAHAVDEHRQTLRGAEHRGGGEAPEIQVGLKRVALGVVDTGAAQRAIQRAGRIDRARSADLVG